MTSENRFFILTRKPDFLLHISAGQICYIRKFNSGPSYPGPYHRTKTVMFVGSQISLVYDIEVEMLEELSEAEAELLLALPDDAERLKWFGRRDCLRAASELTVGTAVEVEKAGERLRGIIRYIGGLTEPTYTPPLSGRYFGIELQDEDKEKGDSDGYYECKRLFTCPKKGGIFVPFSSLEKVIPRSPSPEVPLEPVQLSAGDRVTYSSTSELRHGMVLGVKEKDGQTVVQISTDTDENGKTGGEVEVLLQCVAREEVPAGVSLQSHEPVFLYSSNESNPDVVLTVEPDIAENLYTDLTANSVVELTLNHRNVYGIIRWIGMLPEREDLMAGIELEEDLGVKDGVFRGKRYFVCPPNRALFVKLTSCRPDSRFQSLSSNHNERTTKAEGWNMEGRQETVPPLTTEQVDRILIGRMKGIQGHCNSCYMDAALFSLFCCSSVLDSMLFKSTKPKDSSVQETLLYNIVNPLRSNGFVEGRHVMKLRQQLQKLGYSHSFTTEEKDPEEFLTVVMNQILDLEPLLKLSVGGKVQESYYYQIFLDQKHNLVLPSVQQLLEHSFHSEGIKLAEVPSCLILQMPRFGKKFKMFEKIVPSLELDVTGLLSEGPQQCLLCGNLGEEECTDCFKDPLFSQTGFKLFCRTCSAQVHTHPQRRSHQRSPLDVPKGYVGDRSPRVLARDKLELFAVLCIETSHYVSFIKHGPRSQDWIFFDSMADRQGEREGFNIPEVRACPELGAYLEMCPSELAAEVPRDMRGVARRLFCDAYMYLYQSRSMCLYR